jgi:acetyltransferase
MTYPHEFESETEVGGHKIRIRPVRVEDEATLHAFFAKLAPEDVRMRFLQPLKSAPQELTERLRHIDYSREVALLAFDAGSGELLGATSLFLRPGKSDAEFAMTVRTDSQGLGLGHILMARILAYAWSRGCAEVFGDILAENARMRDFCRKLGAEVTHHPEDWTLLRAVFRPPQHRSGA